MKRLLLCWLALALTGCTAALVGAGAGMGVGTYSYLKGELDVTYPVAYEKVVAATEASVRDLGFTLEKEEKDSLRCRIQAKMADGTGVKLKVDSVSPQITRLRIKVGWFGDKDVSIQIMRAIEKRMKVAPAKEAPPRQEGQTAK